MPALTCTASSEVAVDTDRKLRIFVAEDNRADVYLVDIALKEHKIDYTIRSVCDGEEAIRLVEDFGRSEPLPDLALLDLNLPKQEGHQIMRAIRSQPMCSEIPIIVMTSSENDHDRVVAEEYRAVFFSKPPDLAGFMQLGALVRSLCNLPSKTSIAGA